MKNRNGLYTAAIVFCSIITVGVLLAAIYNFIGFLVSSNKLSDIEQEKVEAVVADHNNFTNTNTKHQEQTLQESTLDDYKHLYMLNDIAFISYSDKWDEAKLEALSLELLKNKHGEEIDYLSKVKLMAESSDTCSGFQETTKETYEIPVSLYNFFPDFTKYDMNSNLSIITLMDADTYTTVEEMADVLSHEYGHHYTEYYFGITYTDSDRFTEYYEIRGKNDPRIRFDLGKSYDEYLENHMWYLFEIGAEDYVFLMGSDTGRQIVEFYDDYDKLYAYSKSESRYNRIDYCYIPSLNGTPHENTYLPMPCEVEGLAEYFYSFIDEEPPMYSQIEPIGDLNLKATKLASQSYKITWDKPYTDDSVLYTLMVLDEDGRLMFLEKTTWGDEKSRARVGSFEIESGNWVYTHTSGLERGEKLIFKVSITFPDGTVVVSDPFEMVFE